MVETTLEKIDAEARRIEEDATHSSKSQFNAGVRYSRYHIWLGVPAAALSAVAGAASFTGQWEIAAGFLSVSVAILAGLQTFMKPAERSVEHKGAGTQYLALRNDTRIFREIRLPRIASDDEAVAELQSLAKRRDDLNASSPQCAPRDFELARKGIDAGESTYRADVATRK